MVRRRAISSAGLEAGLSLKMESEHFVEMDGPDGLKHHVGPFKTHAEAVAWIARHSSNLETSGAVSAFPIESNVVRALDLDNPARRRMFGQQFCSILSALAITGMLSLPSGARPLVVPFDFSRHEIGLDVSIHGAPVYMFLDTGVSPGNRHDPRQGARTED